MIGVSTPYQTLHICRTNANLRVPSGAVTDPIKGEVAGTDVIMPFAPPGWGNTSTGVITEERINDQVLRVLLPYYALDQAVDYPTVDFDRYIVEGCDNIYQTGVEAITLLKNRNRAGGEIGGLPLANQDVGREYTQPRTCGRCLTLPLRCSLR